MSNWGGANRPITSNRLGIPNRSEGSDGDIQVRQTNLGAKLYGKIGGRWNSTFLSSEDEIIGTSGTKIGMDSSGAFTVNEIKLSGKINLKESATGNVIIGENNNDVAGSSNNVIIGHATGSAMESGASNNILMGTASGVSLTNGDDNVVIGKASGLNITTGDKNTSIGTLSGLLIAAVDGNTFLGYAAGALTPSGVNYSTCIGAGTKATGASGIAIGYYTVAAANDCVVGTNSNYITVDFDADANWTHSSDIRMKKNIQDDTLGLSFINNLKTKTFQWKAVEERPEEWGHFILDEDENKEYIEVNTDKVMHGMVAQDVKEALDVEGIDTFSGWKEDENGMQSVGNSAFVIPLIKAVQELSAKIDTMQTEINNLK